MPIKIITITMYYDKYESDFGDGFYPVLDPSQACSTEINIKFVLGYDGYWIQPVDITEKCIQGLDGDTKQNLLKKITEIDNSANPELYIKHFGIKNKYGKILT